MTFVSGNLTNPQFGCQGVCDHRNKSQGVLSLHVAMPQLVILSMPLNTQSADGRQIKEA